ncbi:MAG: hypothetical protein M1840_007865 [Geoglossum simile]|nr:MAG: hypothetical protein M1840_007865 [Geoglossum simile]
MEPLSRDLHPKAIQEMAHPGADRSMLEAMMNLYDFHVGWFMRTYGRGNWQLLHQSLLRLIDERVQVAKSSARFDRLFLRLQDFVATKEQFIILDSLSGIVDFHGILKNFALYLVLLHFSTIQNGSIDQARLRSIPHDGSYQSPGEPDSPDRESPTAQSTLASAGDYGWFMECVGSNQ